MKYIKNFDEIRIKDISLVGGKNASLGEMISQLHNKNIRIPQGFAIISQAYWHFIEHNKLLDKMKKVMASLSFDSGAKNLASVGQKMRTIIEHGTIPKDLEKEIIHAYDQLAARYAVDECTVAVRSSATAEDLPHASFAGQQETYLNVCGKKQLLLSYKKCLASLFTDRAIIYRTEQGFDHFSVALSVGVQKMIRSDMAVSGVAFSLDPESGFKDVVTIEASYGLGETIVKGLVTPDEFIAHKPTMLKGFASIIKKQLGDKTIKMVYAKKNLTKIVRVPLMQQKEFSLSNDEIIELSHYVLVIEKYYSEQKNYWMPMDIEWAKDGEDGLLYIIQARPETIYSGKKITVFSQYNLASNESPVVLVTGLSVGQQIVSGIARIVKNVHDIAVVQQGDIIVTEMTDPDWVPVMKKAAGIITNRGGRTCHAAIVSRELSVPAIVGTGNATNIIKDGSVITLDCSQGLQGYIYEGNIPSAVRDIDINALQQKKLPSIMLNIADPARAFQCSVLPVDGVGLARIEFIIATMIHIHPMALLYPEKIDNTATKKKIDTITAHYNDKKDFFIQTLAQSIATIAAAFYPRPVSVRFSDFKTNEYRNLIGGNYFENVEENPMIGLRGASRYYHSHYKEAFALECEAIKVVRDTMGLTNVKVMIPFVRTVNEAQRVIDEMGKNGLSRSNNDLRIVMMCEIPSNILLIEELSFVFDEFSIGSNDLTQLVLGIDRDSEELASLFNEQNDAVKKMICMAIDGAHKQGKHIGICGQGPSDYPEFANFLMQKNIDSLSLNIDAVIPFLKK